MKKIFFAISLMSTMVLTGCQTNDTTNSTDNDSPQEETSTDTEEQHHHHEEDRANLLDDVVDKEGEEYVVAHGDHYHNIPISDFSEEEQTKIDAYLAEHPNLKEEVEKAKEVYAGYFEDEDVEDRTLQDWQGEWQSVYPYLKDGTLDPVMEAKAQDSEGEKSAEAYKEYYEEGYRTDVTSIKINGDEISFLHEDGSQATASYEPIGTEILEYEKGNRGARPLFSKVSGDEEAPASVQFSDHHVAPSDDIQHFHIYFGNESHKELLEELDNWPTYYPATWDGEDILEDQLDH